MTLLNCWMRLGDDVLVLHGDDGNVETDHLASLAREVTGCGDHVFTGDIVLVRVNDPLAIRLLGNADDRGVAIDLAAMVASAAGHGLGDVGWLNIAIPGMHDTAYQAFGVAEGPDILDFIRGQEIHLHAEGRRYAGILVVLIHAVLVHSEADIANLAQPRVQARFFLQGLIQLHRVAV